MPKKKKTESRKPQEQYRALANNLAAFIKMTEHGGQSDSETFVDLSYSMEKLARRLQTEDDKAKSAAYFKLAVEHLKQHAQIKQDQAQELTLCYSAGQTYALLGLVEEAIQNYEQALKLSTLLQDYKLQARTLRQIGNLKLRQSRWKEAHALFERSRKICLEHGEALEEAYALNSLATGYFQAAAWRKMETACEHARAIAERMNDDELTACVYNNLGAMYNLQGHSDKALAALQKSLPLFEKLGDLRGLAETYNNLATAYRDKEYWNEAGKYYAKSLQLAREIGDAVVEAQASLNRVELYLLMHDLEMAEKQCQIALRVFHGLEHKSGEADACRLMGVVYTRQENWGLALRYLDEALALGSQYDLRLVLAETHRSYVEFWLAKGDRKNAAKHLQKSLEHYRQLKASREIRKLEKLLLDLRTQK